MEFEIRDDIPVPRNGRLTGSHPGSLAHAIQNLEVGQSITVKNKRKASLAASVGKAKNKWHKFRYEQVGPDARVWRIE